MTVASDCSRTHLGIIEIKGAISDEQDVRCTLQR
jgi:hypothetical protein